MDDKHQKRLDHCARIKLDVNPSFPSIHREAQQTAGTHPGMSTQVARLLLKPPHNIRLILQAGFGRSISLVLGISHSFMKMARVLVIPWSHIKGEWPQRSVLRRQLTRSEEHTSELQSLMRISYAVFCLKKKTKHRHK